MVIIIELLKMAVFCMCVMWHGEIYGEVHGGESKSFEFIRRGRRVRMESSVVFVSIHGGNGVWIVYMVCVLNPFVEEGECEWYSCVCVWYPFVEEAECRYVHLSYTRKDMRTPFVYKMWNMCMHKVSRCVTYVCLYYVCSGCLPVSGDVDIRIQIH